MLLSHPSSVTRRFLIIAVLLLGGLLADVVLNQLNVRGLSNPNMWDFPRTVPGLGQAGSDLRILTEGSRQITHGINPYTAVVAYPPPPFAAAFFYPFTWMSSSTAYHVQYWVLIAFNVASIGLIAFCLFRSSARPVEAEGPFFSAVAVVVLVTTVALSLQFHSYGLEFALERGNFDSYVLLLVSAAITCMITWPERVLLPIVLLSAATHLKIYPAILFVLPLLQSWKRAIAPLVVVNVAMLFFFGPGQTRAFFDQIFGYMNAPYIWPGNHSIVAYVHQAIVPLFPQHPDAIQTWVSRGLALLVVGLWGHGILRLKDCVPLSRRWLVIAALSFPLMGALSSTSHDYKLVIYVLPLMVNLYLFAENFLTRGSLTGLVGLGLTLLCGVAIDHSMIVASWPLMETKFPSLFVLLLLTYFQTYLGRERSSPRPEVGVASSSPTRLTIVALVAGAMAIAFFAVKNTNRRMAPPRPESVAGLAPDSAGYGAITMQLKLPGTAANIPEPILVSGRPGAATLVYVRLLPNSQIKVGVEYWGKGAFESAPFDVLASSAFVTVTCAFPCLYPDLGSPEWKEVPAETQRALRESFSITVNDVLRLEGKISYAQPAHLPRYYGRNPVGGSLVSDAFTGGVISAVQLAR